MSNARDTETSPLTSEQKQRAEALRIAASVLSNRNALSAGALPDDRTTDDAIALADYILTGLHPAEIVGDAPEPDDDETCDIGGCERPIRGVPRTVMDYTDRLCAVHANAPEPEVGDASATVKATEVTECQWPGCWEEVDVGIPPTLTVRYATYDYLRPACGTHAGLSVSVG